MRHTPKASTARQSARSDDRHSMSQRRLAAWRERTQKQENLDSRLRGNDGGGGDDGYAP